MDGTYVVRPATTMDSSDRRKRIWAIVSSSSGNLVEWYDFYIYSFCALYFAPSFFPASDRTTQLLNTAGIFAAGFFARPIGSWLFGRIADKRGRRTSMMISVLMMCSMSLAIAVLPTYGMVGALAPALLLLARLVQGLSVGGEYGTVATYMSEVAVDGQRGFFASFQNVSLVAGQLLALLVLLVLQETLSETELRNWGWRIPFAIGGLAAGMVLLLRRSLQETLPVGIGTKKESGSLRALLRHRRALLMVLGLTSGGSLMFYTFAVYMQKYMVNTAGLKANQASMVMTGALVASLLLQPIFGAIADRIGRKRTLIVFGLLSSVAAIPLLGAIGTEKNPYAAFGLVLTALAIVSLYLSIAGLVKAELFPTEVRALGVGLSYAVGNSVFGGTAEYVALYFKQANAEPYFGWYVTALALVALASAIWMPDTRQWGYLEGIGKI